ncbi:MAG: hypothetical protein GY720_15115 [bacterium]|nr:hypothetical protein [bacterium]
MAPIEEVPGGTRRDDGGSSSGTNKSGLLLASIDLAPTVAQDGVFSADDIAEKLIEIHWDDVRPFRSEARFAS